MHKKYLTLNKVKAYKIAFELSNYVWKIVSKWNILAQKTIGEQFIRATDSISANIGEGFGRYYKKDKIRFYQYSFGSVYESLDWNEKSKIRNLLKEKQYEYILSKLQVLPREINHLINYTKEKLKK